MKTLLLFLFTSIVAGGATAAQAEDPATIYANRCAFCHGTTGKGDGPAGVALKPPPTNFADPEYWKSADPAALRLIVSEGKPGSPMVAFKQTLSPQQIDAVVEHLKTFSNTP